MKKRLAILAMLFTFAFGSVNIEAQYDVTGWFENIQKLVDEDDTRIRLPAGTLDGFIEEIKEKEGRYFEWCLIGSCGVVKEDKATGFTYIEIYLMNTILNKEENYIEKYNPRVYVNSGTGWTLVSSEIIEDKISE